MATTITQVDEHLPTVVAATPVLPYEPAADPTSELDRQVDAYVALGVAALTGMGEGDFRAMLAPLRPVVAGLTSSTAGIDPADHVPFVVVVGGGYDLNDAVPAMRRGSRHGVSVIDRPEAATYRPIDGVTIPPGPAYLLTGIDTGSELCDVRPEQALATVTARGRTPLTIAEGLALVTVRPDALRPNKCFSLMASRTTNQRVPAIWISERRPKLGWCWDRNPHTWLGAASALARVPMP